MNKPSVKAFICAAEEFCALAEKTEPVTKKEFWILRELLVRLIFNVPAVDAHPQGTGYEGNRIESDECGRVMKRFSNFPFNFYCVVFNPHNMEAKDEPVTGMLADDLADIYRDLAEGLDMAKNGHLDVACFNWSQSYMGHWARHAVNALAAIEIYRTDNYERVEQADDLNG